MRARVLDARVGKRCESPGALLQRAARPLALLSEAASGGRGAEMGFGCGARIAVPVEEAGAPRDAPERGKSVLGSHRDS